MGGGGEKVILIPLAPWLRVRAMRRQKIKDCRQKDPIRPLQLKINIILFHFATALNLISGYMQIANPTVLNKGDNS
jgi:hypothetical protein